jgi:hypothetical protein
MLVAPSKRVPRALGSGVPTVVSRGTARFGPGVGFQMAFLGGAVVAALGVVATLVLIRTRDSKAHVEMSGEQAGTAAA